MVKKRGYKYGFIYKSEYSKYKEVCNKRNITITYSNWYEEISNKYDCYDISKLRDFEKYINWLICQTNKCKETIKFLSSICSYVISIVLPIIAIIVPMMTYLDSIQARLDEAMLQEVMKESGAQLVAEQLQYRVDIFGQTLNLVVTAIYIAVLFIIPMLIFFLLKMHYKQSIQFLVDYKDCIEKIKEEKTKE